VVILCTKALLIPKLNQLVNPRHRNSGEAEVLFGTSIYRPVPCFRADTGSVFTPTGGWVKHPVMYSSKKLLSLEATLQVS